MAGVEEQSRELAVVLMGSPRDVKPVESLVKILSFLRVSTDVRTTSAHRTPIHAYDILSAYNTRTDPTVIIAAVGRIHALSGFVDANTRFPSIALCLFGNNFQVEEAIAALRTPSRVAPLVIIEPENAALAAAKILALSNPALAIRIDEYQREPAQEVIDSDPKLREHFRELWLANPLQQELDAINT